MDKLNATQRKDGWELPDRGRVRRRKRKTNHTLYLLLPYVFRSPLTLVMVCSLFADVPHPKVIREMQEALLKERAYVEALQNQLRVLEATTANQLVEFMCVMAEEKQHLKVPQTNKQANKQANDQATWLPPWLLPNWEVHNPTHLVCRQCTE